MLVSKNSMRVMAGIGAVSAIAVSLFFDMDLIPQSLIGLASLRVFFQVINAPILEEFFFRMLLYPSLKMRVGKIGAAILSSLFWAFLHLFAAGGSVATLAVVFTVGVFIALVNDSGKTYNAWFGLAFHSTFNVIQVLG